jgi:hypothetical protein
MSEEERQVYWVERPGDDGRAQAEKMHPTQKNMASCEALKRFETILTSKCQQRCADESPVEAARVPTTVKMTKADYEPIPFNGRSGQKLLINLHLTVF